MHLRMRQLLDYGVMVAQQTLTLSVWVRIPLVQRVHKHVQKYFQLLFGKKGAHMSYKTWLYNELVGSDIIDEEAYSPDDDDFNASTLFSDAQLDPEDFEDYHEAFKEYCSSIGVEPIWDFNEDI